MLTDVQRELLTRPMRKVQLLMGVIYLSMTLFWIVVFVAVLYFEVPVQVSGMPFVSDWFDYIAVGIACVVPIMMSRLLRESRADTQKRQAEGKPLEFSFLSREALDSEEFRDVVPAAIDYCVTRLGWTVMLVVGLAFNLMAYLVSWKMMNLIAAGVMGTGLLVLLVFLFPTRSRWERWIERRMAATAPR